MNDIGKLLIGLGVALIIIGLVFGTELLNFGRLPGDLVWRRGNMTVFIPLGTMLLVSLVISIVLTLLRRR